MVSNVFYRRLIVNCAENCVNWSGDQLMLLITRMAIQSDVAGEPQCALNLEVYGIY